MITWKHTGEAVKAKLGYTFGFMEAQLVKITRHQKMVIKIQDHEEKSISVKVNRLTFKDRTGTQYHTYIKFIDFILPEHVVPTNNIYKLMNIEDGDYIDET